MRNRRPLVVAAISVVAALLVVVVLIMPKRSQMGTLHNDLDQAQQQTQQLTAQVAELNDARKQAPAVRRQLQKLEREVPATADLPGLLRRLKRAADRSAVNLDSIAPSTPTSAGQYSTVPVNLSVSGSYFAVQEFLFRMETFARGAKVTGAVLTGGRSAGPELQVQISANFFTIDTSVGPGSEPGTQAVLGGA